jgi:hypothetical protein
MSGEESAWRNPLVPGLSRTECRLGSRQPENLDLKTRVQSGRKIGEFQALQYRAAADFDIGLYLKRVRAAAEQRGDWAFHAERYAAIQGF